MHYNWDFFFFFFGSLGLLCCLQTFSSCSKRRLLFIVVLWLVTALVSLVAEHELHSTGFGSCGAQP